jgi:hypothetical protein
VQLCEPQSRCPGGWGVHDLAVMLGACALCAVLISHRVTEVARGLAPGPHTLHCELLEPTRDSKGGNEFRIFAVVHD